MIIHCDGRLESLVILGPFAQSTFVDWWDPHWLRSARVTLHYTFSHEAGPSIDKVQLFASQEALASSVAAVQAVTGQFDLPCVLLSLTQLSETANLLCLLPKACPCSQGLDHFVTVCLRRGFSSNSLALIAVCLQRLWFHEWYRWCKEGIVTKRPFLWVSAILPASNYLFAWFEVVFAGITVLIR